MKEEFIMAQKLFKCPEKIMVFILFALLAILFPILESNLAIQKVNDKDVERKFYQW